MVKLCRDCKWCEGAGSFAKCRAPAGRKRTVQRTGFEERNEYAKWKYCDIQREDAFILAYVMGSCGKQARWWERK